MTVTTEDILKHYGVKGMEWGIRRYQPYPKGKKHKGRFLGKVRQIRDNRLEKYDAKKRTSKDKKAYKHWYNSELKKAQKKDKFKNDPGGAHKEAVKKTRRLMGDSMPPLQAAAVTAFTLYSGKKFYGAVKNFQVPMSVAEEIARRGRNAVEKAKRSGIRYPSADEIKDFIDMAGNNLVKQSSITTDDILQHYGVKGMKWGIRRYQPYPKGEGPSGRFIGDKIRNSRVGQEVRSGAREARALMGKNKIHDMSTKEIQQRTRRLQQENEMKRITSNRRSSASTRKSRQDYRNRGDMSDEELNRKVERLRAQDLYNQNANKAGKEIIDAGKRVAKSAAALGASYKTKGGVDATDVYDAIMTPEHSLVKSAGELFGNNEHVQEFLKKKLSR